MKKFILFWRIILLTIFLSSCTQIAYRTSGGGYRPVKPDFELSKQPFQLTDTTYIDTNAVYICKFIGYDRLTRYFFYRFWGNGRVYVSDAFNNLPLNNEDLNYTNGGLIGYYRLENNNELTTEIFYPVNTGRPIFEEYGIAYGDSIVIDKEENYLFYFKRRVKKDPEMMKKLQKYKEPWFSLISKPNW